MTSDEFAGTEAEFEDWQLMVSGQVQLGARLPEWPFVTERGYATIFEYDRILSGPFGSVLAELARTYSDDAITVVAIEPDSAYYRREYKLLPALRLRRESIERRYGELIRFEPAGDPTGSLEVSANVLVITGTSGLWAVFAQRDWEIGLLLTTQAHRPGLGDGVQSFGPETDIRSLRSPDGWGVPIADDARTEFERNVRQRSAPSP